MSNDDSGYVEGGWAELHPFEPAERSDACLYRMAEGYVCGSPRSANIHRPAPETAVNGGTA